MTTRSFLKRLVVSCFAGAGLLGSLPGCGDSASNLERVEPGTEKPDMNKMPGFNEMQGQMKGKKGATTAPAK